MKKSDILDKTSKISIKTVVVFSAALLVISSVAYWKYVVTNPDRIFESMLKNSLQTKSVTKVVEQGEQGDYNKQTIALRFSPSLGVVSKYDLSRGQNEQQISTQTNVIGTKNADFIRYSKIESAQVSEQKKNEIIGVWAKVGDDSSGQNPSVLNDALFGVILFGDLGANQTDDMLNQLTSNNVYGIEKSSTSFRNGRLIAKVSIQVKPKNLVESIKYYSELTGYTNAEALGAESVSNEPISLDLKIDLVSRQVTEINFAGGQRIEKYGAYGQYKGIVIPNDPIPFSELSKKLQTAQ